VWSVGREGVGRALAGGGAAVRNPPRRAGRSPGSATSRRATILTARREPRLLSATAGWHGGEAEIVGRDGERLDSDAALSAWLDRPVELARADDEGGVYEK
jgi:hypothetical protein